MKKKLFSLIFIFCIMMSSMFLSACGDASPTGIKVLIDGSEVTATNNTVTITYNQNYPENWQSRITVFELFDDGNEKQLFNEFQIITNGSITEANEEGYNVTVKYGSYESVNLKLIVEKYAVSRPEKNSNSFSYDGVTTHRIITNEINSTYYTKTSGTISEKNAGNYSATFTLVNSNYKWLTPDENNSVTAPHVINWEVEKAVVNIPNSSIGVVVYNDEEQLPQISSTEYEIASNNYDFIEAGVYNLQLELVDPDNYMWSDNSITPKNATYTITMNEYNNIINAQQTSVPTYATNLNGTEDNKNPLNISFAATYGNNNDAIVEIKNSENTELMAYYKRINGIWKLFDNNNQPINTINAGNYQGNLYLPATSSYSETTKHSLSLEIRPILINKNTLPTIDAQNYNGTVLTAGIENGEHWTVDSKTSYMDSEFINRGDHYVGITAETNYAFYDGTNESNYYCNETILFVINAGIITLKDLELEDWEYLSDPQVPTINAFFGDETDDSEFPAEDIFYKWSGSENDWDTAIIFNNTEGYYPTEIGEYYIKAFTEYNYNYGDEITESNNAVSFKILPRDISNTVGESPKTVVTLENDYFWIGSNDTVSVTPKHFTVKYNDTELAYDRYNIDAEANEYSVSVINNNMVGTAKLIIEGKKTYRGSVEVDFEIINSLENVENNKKIEFASSTTINNALEIKNKNLTFVINTGVAITSNIQDNNFITICDEVVGETPVPTSLTILGGGEILSTVGDNYATIYVNGQNSELNIFELYTIYSEYVTIKTFQSTDGAKVSSLAINSGKATIIAEDDNSTNDEKTIIESDYLNLKMSGGTLNVNGGTFRTKRAGLYLYGNSPVANLNAGKFSLNDTLAYLKDELVGAEIITGTLSIKSGVNFTYDVGSNSPNPKNLVLNEPGKIKAAIVVGKPQSASYSGNITLNIADDTTIKNRANTSTSDDLLILWDITYGYGEYTFTHNLGNKAHFECAYIEGYKTFIKRNDNIHPATDFEIVTLSNDTLSYQIDSTAYINDPNGNVFLSFKDFTIGDIVVGNVSVYGYYNNDYWCSNMYETFITGYNDMQVNVSYDDCNPFGMIAGNFGDIENISKHATHTASNAIISDFNTLSVLFATFMSNFEVPDSEEYKPTVSGDALLNYTAFYNKAIEIYNKSYIPFTQSIANTLNKSAVIGLNNPYSMIVGNEVNLDDIDLQTVIANMFGFSSKVDFLNYAETLKNTYDSLRTRCINGTTTETDDTLLNGCFYTDNKSFVFPIAVNNGLSSKVLAYVIMDEGGNVSIWVNDITAALWATNYNVNYHTENEINNTLYCKTKLFITGESNFVYDDYWMEVAIGSKEYNDVTKLWEQTITFIGRGRIMGTATEKIYYLDPEHLQTGLDSLQSNSIVTCSSNLDLLEPLEIKGVNIIFVIPSGRKIIATTLDTANGSSSAKDKSAIIISAKGGTASSVTFLGGGSINGRQAYNLKNNSNENVYPSAVELTDSNLIYVENGSELKMFNINCYGKFGGDENVKVNTLIYVDGSVTIDEDCSLNAENSCIYVAAGKTLKVVKGKDDRDGVYAYSQMGDDLINNYGTVDLSESEYGTDDFLLSSNGEEPPQYINEKIKNFGDGIVIPITQTI